MKIDNPKISVIVPIMNEEGNIELLIRKISDVLNNYFDWELLFVDDGSKDKTLNIIKEQSTKNNKIKYISFSRNF
jgi:dolichol-phosphate mannosyltransferase